MKRKVLPRLYRKQGNRLRYVELKIEGTDDHAIFYHEWGFIDGLVQSKATDFTEGKRGKTAYEQACSEAASLHELKIKKNKYATNINEAVDPSEAELPPPMLAKSYIPAKHTVPYYMQPKLDGNRCVAKVDYEDEEVIVTLYSRQGNIFSGLDHIVKSLEEIALNTKESFVFDGELFTWAFPFKDLNGALKRKPKDLSSLKTEKSKEKARLKNVDDQEQKQKIQFWVFDIPSVEGTTKARISALKEYIENVSHDDKPRGSPGYTEDTDGSSQALVLVPTFEVTTEKDAQELHCKFCEAGYEGSIVRLPDCMYKYNSRSPSLLKRKDFSDDNYIILDVVPFENQPECGTFVCQTESGKQFKATPKCSHEERAALLTNKDEWIGETINVMFFEKFEDGTPRFPVAKMPK